MTRILRLIQDDRGATAIEYGLIVAMISIAIVGGLNYFASETLGMWNRIATTMDNSIT